MRRVPVVLIVTLASALCAAQQVSPSIYDTGSKVGIGGTTPAGKLDVAGDLYTSSIAARYDYSGTTFTPHSQMRRIYFYIDTGGESAAHYWKIATLQVTSDGWSGGAIGGKVFVGASDRGGSSAEFTLFTNKAPGGNLVSTLAEFGVATGRIAYKYRANANGSYLDAVDLYAIGGWYQTIYGYIDIGGSSGVTYSVWSNGTDMGTGAPSGSDLPKNSDYHVNANSWTFTPPNASSFAVNNTGNVGIGTANPSTSHKLDLRGDALVTGSLMGLHVLDPNTAVVGGLMRYATSSGADLWASGLRGYAGALTNDLYFSRYTGSWSDVMVLQNSTGYVGIGTINPNQRLEVAGNARIDGSLQFSDGTNQTTAWTGVLCGGDYAESVGVSGANTLYEPGDVIVIDPANPQHFLKSSTPYAATVAGIYSTKPGAIGRRTKDPEVAKAEIPMAMVGIVPTKVTAENGAIKVGDLLVTSATAGHAMRGTDRSQMLGAVVGKALEPLRSGTGVINVLVTLQ